MGGGDDNAHQLSQLHLLSNHVMLCFVVHQYLLSFPVVHLLLSELTPPGQRKGTMKGVRMGASRGCSLLDFLDSHRSGVPVVNGIVQRYDPRGVIIYDFDYICEVRCDEVW